MLRVEWKEFKAELLKILENMKSIAFLAGSGISIDTPSDLPSGINLIV